MNNLSMLKNKQNAESLILSVGIILRLICFISNLFIGGYFSDEVVTLLNSFSIADTLSDINGNHLPVYFEAWVIGGQSPFAVYISALSARIFGNSLFAARLPMFIISIISFVVFLKIIELVFRSDKYRITAKALTCISPWMLFSSAYVLDCNYITHMLIIGSYFLLVAIRDNKTVFYVISMVFFGLGFYCYIASVLIIPLVLVAVYLVLIMKKRISVKNVVISVLTVMVVSSIFILFGLVVVGVLPETNVFGINISKMPDYSRGGSVLFLKNENIFLQAIKNIAVSFVFIAFSDVCATGIGNCIFQFGNLLGGLFFVFGIIVIAKKGRKNSSFLFKIFTIISVTAISSYCLLTNDTYLITAYRYGILSYFLVFIESVGFVTFLSNVNKINYKKALSVYLSLSLALFGFEYGYIYARQTDNDTLFGDSLFKCLDFLEQEQQDDIVIYSSNDINSQHCSVFLRYYYYGSDVDFVKLGDEQYNRMIDENKNATTTNDDSIVIITQYNNTIDFLEDGYFVIDDYLVDKIDTDAYEVTDFGYCNVVHKN